MLSETDIKRTPLYHWHKQHGARFSNAGGWQIPAVYAGATTEIEAARDTVTFADISHCAKVKLIGAGVSALANSLENATQIRCVQSLPGEHAPVACRLNGRELLLIGTSSKIEYNSDAFQLHATVSQMEFSTQHEKVTAINVTSGFAGFSVIGPKTEMLLRKLTSLDVSKTALPVHSCAETSLAGVHAILVRISELAVPSVRIYVACDLAEWVWTRLLESGQQEKIVPLGMEAYAQLKADDG